MVWMRNLVLSLCCTICFNVAVNAQNVVRIDLAHPLTPQSGGSLTLLAPNVATKDYGFFCRQELKGDKALPMPVRLRLGGMQQTDWLEQKPNAIAPAR